MEWTSGANQGSGGTIISTLRWRGHVWKLPDGKIRPELIAYPEVFWMVPCSEFIIILYSFLFLASQNRTKCLWIILIYPQLTCDIVDHIIESKILSHLSAERISLEG